MSTLDDELATDQLYYYWRLAPRRMRANKKKKTETVAWFRISGKTDKSKA